MSSAQPGGVELGDAPAVRRQRMRPGLGVVEQRVDAASAPAVDERFEVPRDVGGGAGRLSGDGRVRGGSCPRTVRAREAERFGQRLGVHDDEAAGRPGEHHVEEAQAAAVGRDERAGSTTITWSNSRPFASSR